MESSPVVMIRWIHDNEMEIGMDAVHKMRTRFQRRRRDFILFVMIFKNAMQKFIS